MISRRKPRKRLQRRFSDFHYTAIREERDDASVCCFSRFSQASDGCAQGALVTGLNPSAIESCQIEVAAFTKVELSDGAHKRTAVEQRSRNDVVIFCRVVGCAPAKRGSP